MPISETMFMVMPAKFIREKVATTETGMATAMIRVEGMLRRNTSRTRTARSPPCQAAPATLPMELRICRDWSDCTSIRTDGGRRLRKSAISALTRRLTSTVFCPGCLRTASCTASAVPAR